MTNNKICVNKKLLKFFFFIILFFGVLAGILSYINKYLPFTNATNIKTNNKILKIESQEKCKDDKRCLSIKIKNRFKKILVKTDEDLCFEEIFTSKSEVLMRHINQAVINNNDKCLEKINFSDVSTNRLNPIFVKVNKSLSSYSRNHILSTILKTAEIINDSNVVNMWFYYKFDIPIGMSKITIADENNDQKIDTLDKLYLYVVIPKDKPSSNQMASVLNTTYHEVDHSVRFYNRYKNNQGVATIPDAEETQVDFYGNLVEYLFRRDGMVGEETKNIIISRDGLIAFELAYKLDNNSIFPENHNLYSYFYSNGYRYQILYVLLDYFREIYNGNDDQYLSENLEDYVQIVNDIDQEWSNFWQKNSNNQLYKNIVNNLFINNIINPYFFTDNPYHLAINNDSPNCYQYQNSGRCILTCKKSPPEKLKNFPFESLYCLSYPALNCCNLSTLLPY